MITEERIQELVRQALAYEAVSDPRRQIEMTIRAAARESAAAENEACAKLCESVSAPATWYDCQQAIRARRGAGEGAGG